MEDSASRVVITHALAEKHRVLTRMIDQFRKIFLNHAHFLFYGTDRALTRMALPILVARL